jgi:DNA invertase Pin-like site-specific DNA recombinase
MTTHGHHFTYNLDDNESPVSRMIRMIEVYAPRYMRIGGGALGNNDDQIKRKAPVRTTPEQRARILELARTGQHHQCAIARMVGVTQSSVWHLLRKMGIRCPDARKEFGCPAHKQK